MPVSALSMRKLCQQSQHNAHNVLLILREVHTGTAVAPHPTYLFFCWNDLEAVIGLKRRSLKHWGRHEACGANCKANHVIFLCGQLTTKVAHFRSKIRSLLRSMHTHIQLCLIIFHVQPYIFVHNNIFIHSYRRCHGLGDKSLAASPQLECGF